jgi:hypothetical protein
MWVFRFFVWLFDLNADLASDHQHGSSWGWYFRATVATVFREAQFVT